jgi:hypothetical protein
MMLDNSIEEDIRELFSSDILAARRNTAPTRPFVSPSQKTIAKVMRR